MGPDTIQNIIEKYAKFIEGHDEDWIFDETYQFFNDLTRSELVDVMNYLISKK